MSSKEKHMQQSMFHGILLDLAFIDQQNPKLSQSLRKKKLAIGASTVSKFLEPI
jgi:hypothetical protein